MTTNYHVKTRINVTPMLVFFLPYDSNQGLKTNFGHFKFNYEFFCLWIEINYVGNVNNLNLCSFESIWNWRGRESTNGIFRLIRSHSWRIFVTLKTRISETDQWLYVCLFLSISLFFGGIVDYFYHSNNMRVHTFQGIIKSMDEIYVLFMCWLPCIPNILLTFFFLSFALERI